MKKLLTIFLFLFSGCGYEVITNECDDPTMFVIVYGNSWEDETNPTDIKYLDEIKKYHEGKIRKIIYFCNDKQLQKYLDKRYPLLELDNEVLQ